MNHHHYLLSHYASKVFVVVDVVVDVVETGRLRNNTARSLALTYFGAVNDFCRRPRSPLTKLRSGTVLYVYHITIVQNTSTTVLIKQCLAQR